MPAFSPVPSSHGKGNANSSSMNAASVISKEYLDAVSVMNEDNMNRACYLLLKACDSDGGAASNNESTQQAKEKKTEAASKGSADSTKSVPDQLLEMYYKCQESLTVIRKQQSLPPGINLKGTNHHHHHHTNKMLPPGAPSLNGMKKRTVMTSKHGIHPSHKTSSSAIGLAMAMKRKASFNNNKLIVGSSNSKMGGTGMTVAAHGKAMLGHHRGNRSISPPQASSSLLRGSGEESSASAAPPPSALSFLAKLNRDPNETLADDKSAKRSKEENSSEERELSERPKKSKKKKKAKSKQKSSDEDESNAEKETNEETDDSDKKEGLGSRRRKRRRPSNDDDNGNEKSHEPILKRKKASNRNDPASKKRHKQDTPSGEDEEDRGEEEPLLPLSEGDDNDDGDTSADETYYGVKSETSPSKRKSFSRKAKPDAETLAGGSPPTKRRKTRNHSIEARAESSDDPSPSRRRNPRRGATQS